MGTDDRQPEVTVPVSGTAVVAGTLTTTAKRSAWRRLDPSERVWTMVTACLLLVCMATALIVAGFALRSADASSASATRQAAANSKQIVDLNELILAGRAATSAKLLCDQMFDTAVTQAFREYQAHIGDLIEQSITEPAAVNMEIDEMGAALDDYRAVAAQQTQYIDAGRPQPCPLTP